MSLRNYPLQNINTKSKMIRLLFFFLFPLSVLAINQNEAESFVLEGNQLFSEKNFQEAISSYQKALTFRESAQVIFNIGQCYYALQKPGFALAYFLKAKRINPQWKLLTDTLHSFYQQYPQFTNKPFPWYCSLFNSFHWDTWILLITILAGLTICLFTSYQLFYHKKSILYGSLGFLMLFILGGFLLILNYPFKNLYFCPETAPVLFGPTDNSPVRYNLLPGTKCTIKEMRSDYYFINTLDDKDGWIKKESLISL